MTDKIKFDEYDGLLFCKKCGRFVPKKHTDYKKVYPDWSISKCNVCQWIERHKGLPIFKKFEEDIVLNLLYEFIYFDPICVNKLSERYKKTISDIIELFNFLHIKGKKIYIESDCSFCGKKIINNPSVFEKTKNLYCSEMCYWEDKKRTSLFGEENLSYKRITTNCTNCNKEIKVIPFDYNKTNSFGDNHNFCSQECYWEYRSKYYIKEKGAMYAHNYTEEQKSNLRNGFLKRLSSENRLNTSIQFKINELLEQLNIGYQREYVFDYYSVDNYLTANNLIIEVMGDYWHCSPLLYNANNKKINHIQRKQIHRDKLKHSYIKNHNNINILYLWESDIKNNINKCKELILLYISNKGILKNYHSFNYYIKNDSLFLCNELIIPYQDKSIDEYIHLTEDYIKESVETAGFDIVI